MKRVTGFTGGWYRKLGEDNWGNGRCDKLNFMFGL